MQDSSIDGRGQEDNLRISMRLQENYGCQNEVNPAVSKLAYDDGEPLERRVSRRACAAMDECKIDFRKSF